MTKALVLSQAEQTQATAGLIPLADLPKAVEEIRAGVLVASGPTAPRNSAYGIEAWALDLFRRCGAELVSMPKGPRARKRAFEIMGQIACGEMQISGYENGGVQNHIKAVRDRFDPETRFFFEGDE